MSSQETRDQSLSEEVDTLKADLEWRAASARHAVRSVERFAYRIVADAVTAEDVEEAQRILRLAKGLRRRLDLWGGGK
jgi:hypothetical protein